MIKNEFGGKFIALEGLDGCGKSSQIVGIENYLKENNKRFWLTREPTSGIIGQTIRKYISGQTKLNSPVSLQLLFTADRADHLEQDIIPKLKANINVITDRYFLSSLAYGSLDIPDDKWLADINDKFLLPDLTIIIKTSTKTSIERIQANRSEIDYFEKAEKLEKIWDSYEILAKKYPNIIIIDGERSMSEVFKDIKDELAKII